jgi:hypothetical protein
LIGPLRVKAARRRQPFFPIQQAPREWDPGGNMVTMTKDEVKAAIVASMAKLGHVPSRAELLKQAGVTPRHIRKHFGTYRSALEACGQERSGSGKKVRMQALFEDWSEIVRTLKKVPTLVEYEQRSRYSVRPLTRAFSSWTNVPDGMKLYAEGEGLAEEYKDVLDVIEHRTVREYDVPKVSVPTSVPKIFEGPADVWPAVTGVSAGVCANERGRGVVPFWGDV